MVHSIKYTVIDKMLNTTPPQKTNSSDAGFEICVSSLKTKTNSNSIHVYGTNLTFNLPIGYYIELHALNSLFYYGYLLANGIKTIEPSESNNEVLIHLVKFNEKNEDVIPQNTPICKVLLKKAVYCLSPKESTSP